MSLEHELAASSLVLADQREHIKELEDLIRDWSAFMQRNYTYTWNNYPDGLLIQERIRELGILERKS